MTESAEFAYHLGVSKPFKDFVVEVLDEYDLPLVRGHYTFLRDRGLLERLNLPKLLDFLDKVLKKDNIGPLSGFEITIEKGEYEIQLSFITSSREIKNQETIPATSIFIAAVGDNWEGAAKDIQTFFNDKLDVLRKRYNLEFFDRAGRLPMTDEGLI